MKNKQSDQLKLIVPTSINAKRIGMAMVILLIGLSLFAVQIQAQVDKPVPVQENFTQAEKIKIDQPKIVQAPTSKISKEEQSLNDQLIMARKAGNQKSIQDVEDKIVAIHGTKLSYINSEAFRPINKPRNINASNIIEPLTTSFPCVTCNGPGGATNGRPDIVHDKRGYLFTAVSTTYSIDIYASQDGGNSWIFWDYIYLGGGIKLVNPSIVAADDYLFVATDVNNLPAPTDPSYHEISVWRINIISKSATRTDFNAGHTIDKFPKVVTDYSEYPNNWWVYLVFTDGSGHPSFTRSENHGGSWTTPSYITTSIPDRYVSFDYGGGYLHAVIRQGNVLSYISNSNFGYSLWKPFALTGGTDEQYSPSVAAVKSSIWTRDGHVVVAYERNWRNSGDLDIWYAYSLDHGATWSLNNCLECFSMVNEYDPNVVTDDNLGMFHMAYRVWTNYPYTIGNIYYTSTPYNQPDLFHWRPTTFIDTGNTAIQPTITVNPFQASIAWVNSNDKDVYFHEVQI